MGTDSDRLHRRALVAAGPMMLALLLVVAG